MTIFLSRLDSYEKLSLKKYTFTCCWSSVCLMFSLLGWIIKRLSGNYPLHTAARGEVCAEHLYPTLGHTNLPVLWWPFHVAFLPFSVYRNLSPCLFSPFPLCFSPIGPVAHWTSLLKQGHIDTAIPWCILSLMAWPVLWTGHTHRSNLHAPSLSGTSLWSPSAAAQRDIILWGVFTRIATIRDGVICDIPCALKEAILKILCLCCKLFCDNGGASLCRGDIGCIFMTRQHWPCLLALHGHDKCSELHQGSLPPAGFWCCCSDLSVGEWDQVGSCCCWLC